MSEESMFKNAPPKLTFFLGSMIGIAAISTVGFFIVLTMLNSDGTSTSKSKSGTVAAAKDAAPTPTPAPTPTADPTADPAADPAAACEQQHAPQPIGANTSHGTTLALLQTIRKTCPAGEDRALGYILRLRRISARPCPCLSPGDRRQGPAGQAWRVRG